MTSAHPTATRWLSGGTGAALLLALLLVSASAASAEEWHDVLERAADVARSTPYEGEALLLSISEDRPHLFRVHVRHTEAQGLVIGGEDGPQLSLDAEGGGLVPEGADGTVAALFSIGLGGGDDFSRLEAKYDVAVTGVDHVMNRACTKIEITRRGDGELRERLWFDDESGLLVRRETFEDDPEPVRMAAYLSLDLDPQRVQSNASRAARSLRVGTATGAVADPLEDREVRALREAGWVVPDALPDGYEPLGTFAVDAGTSHPLQLVYGDGLYVVSVFQQRGTPDWSSLPPGASRVAELDFQAYEWPGAVPQRLVWEAEGRTWSLVGDAPPAELLALASALPSVQSTGLLERLRRGLGRLWAWVTP